MHGFTALLRKDLRLELRSGNSTIAMLALSMLVLVVLVFAIGAGAPRNPDAASGALWIATIFAGMLGATRVTMAENENGCLAALLMTPIDPGTLFAAKVSAAFIFMAVAELGAAVMMVLFFNLDFDPKLAALAPVLMLGTLGFAALATLLSAISGRTRAGDLLLPLLAVPMFVPALIAGVKASAAVLTGGPMPRFWEWIEILVAFDLLFVTTGYLLFEHVARED